MYNIKPLRDIVFLKKIEEDTTTKSGIVLSETDKKKQISAEVIFKGPEVKTVNIKDFVLVNSYSFEEYELEGEKYLVGSEKDLLGVKINE